MSKKKHIPGTTVIVTSLPQGRDLTAELLGAEAIVIKQETKLSKHMHTIDTVRSVGGRRRFVLIPGTCLKKVDENKRKAIMKEPKLQKQQVADREEKEKQLDFISDELKAWPLSGMDPESSAYEEIWNKRLKLHAMRIKLMHELYP